MDHAEAQAWLQEAFFRPGALRRLEEDADPGTADEGEVAAVREHLGQCAACRQELRSLRATSVALDVGLGAPPAAQERMLARVRQLGRQRERAGEAIETAAVPQPLWRRLPALGWAAVLLVVLAAFGAGALLGLNAPERAELAGPRLELAAALMTELLSEPDARSFQLFDASNSPAGMVVHSVARQQLAVVSASLERPAEGRYECYLERDGQRTLIGPMHFEDETAFWAGRMGGPADAGRSGDRFLVMLEGQSRVVLRGQF